MGNPKHENTRNAKTMMQKLEMRRLYVTGVCSVEELAMIFDTAEDNVRYIVRGAKRVKRAGTVHLMEDMPWPKELDRFPGASLVGLTPEEAEELAQRYEQQKGAECNDDDHT